MIVFDHRVDLLFHHVHLLKVYCVHHGHLDVQCYDILPVHLHVQMYSLMAHRSNNISIDQVINNFFFINVNKKFKTINTTYTVIESAVTDLFLYCFCLMINFLTRYLNYIIIAISRMVLLEWYRILKIIKNIS